MSASDDSAIAIPGYELLEKVGEGGMGTVYRARQLSLQRIVAVKVLRGAADGRPAPRAFQSETQLLASLSHPNVLAIHDCAQSQGRYYLVTEFVPGTSLRSMLTPREPWSVPRALALLDQVARALSYIHGHGILHLDLKPENVLCTPEGAIKIADFGLAQPRAETGAAAEPDQAQGTADYCPLEQRHGLPTDERSDLYSLAVLSYELLTGRLPGRAYEKPSGLNPALPAAVDEVLRRGLARRPENRQASVEAFRRELTAALQPKPPWRRWVAVLAGAALVVLVVGFLFRDRFRTWGGPEAVSPRAWLIADDSESLAALATMSAGLSEPVASVQAGAHSAGAEGDPPLPCWPTPRPALFITSPEGDGFFHPLFGKGAGRELLLAWPGPLQWPAVPPEDNFILAGDFAGKQIWQQDNGGPWMQPPGHEWKPGDGIRVACPPDRPGNPALLLDKSDTAVATPLVCYQWLHRLPDPPGTVMVLRYRARAEVGTGRLSVGPTMPLYIPKDDHSPVAEALRRRSTAHTYMPPKEGTDVREYRLADWVQPTAEWRTYCVVWEWPSYATEGGGRNVVVEYQGLGKVWLDEVGLFPWEHASKR